MQFNLRRKLTDTKKFWLAFILIFIILLIIINFFIIRSAIAEDHEHRNISVNLRADLIESDITGSFPILQSYASRPLLKEALLSKNYLALRPHLADIRHRFPAAELAVIADINGILLMNEPYNPIAINRNMSHRDWFKGTTAAWKPYASNVFQRVYDHNKNTYALCVPVFKSDKAPLGVLCVFKNSKTIEKLFNKSSFKEHTRRHLLDRQGNLLYSSALPYSESIMAYPDYAVLKNQAGAASGRIELKSEKGWLYNRHLSFIKIDGVDWITVQECANYEIILSECERFIFANSMVLLIFLSAFLLISYQRKIQLKTSVINQKQMLLKEVHHRIKNNMGTIHSLLVLQSAAQNEPEAKSQLLQAASRVSSMVVLYDRLYRSDNLTAMNVNYFFPDLIREIISFFPLTKTVQTELDLDDIELPPSFLSATGIIVQELLTNSMKYAFADTAQPRVELSLKKTGKELKLVYQDNGQGIPDSLEMNGSTGFGLELIKMLTEQVNGTLLIEKTPGLKFIISIPL